MCSLDSFFSMVLAKLGATRSWLLSAKEGGRCIDLSGGMAPDIGEVIDPYRWPP